MAKAETLIKISRLSKEYPDFKINLENLSFDPGKIYTIIGPSGAGKSTFLQMMNLLQESDFADMIIFNASYPFKPTKRLEIQRQMSMVFQKPVLLNRTVAENLEYPIRVRGELSNVAELVNKTLQMVGLKDKAQQMAPTLSGGEAQRLALARAIITNPKILFLDEATANLDPANVQIVENLLIDAKQKGMCIIMASHNLLQVQRLADEIIFIYEGHIVEKGLKVEVMQNPKDNRTQKFLTGEMVW